MSIYEAQYSQITKPLRYAVLKWCDHPWWSQSLHYSRLISIRVKRACTL